METWNVVLGGNLRDHFHPFEKMVIFQLQGGSMAKYPFSIAETFIPDGSGDKEILLITNPYWETAWAVPDQAIVLALGGMKTITGTAQFF